MLWTYDRKRKRPLDAIAINLVGAHSNFSAIMPVVNVQKTRVLRQGGRGTYSRLDTHSVGSWEGKSLSYDGANSGATHNCSK